MIHRLYDKKIYSGNQEIRDVFLGNNRIYQAPGGYIEPYAFIAGGGMYAYDFTQGLTEPYATKKSSYLSPPSFQNVTPVYTGTSMYLDSGYLRVPIEAASAYTTSYYLSMTFDTETAPNDVFYISMSGGHNKVKKYFSGSNVRYQFEVRNGLGTSSAYSPIITTPQITVDVYVVNANIAKFWVNGIHVEDISASIRTTSMNGWNSSPTIYGPSILYDYKVHINPGSTPFTDDIILEQYQNIQQRLKNI